MWLVTASPAWSLPFFFPYETVSCEIMLTCRRCCNEQKTSDSEQRGINRVLNDSISHMWALQPRSLSIKLTGCTPPVHSIFSHQEGDVLTGPSVRQSLHSKSGNWHLIPSAELWLHNRASIAFEYFPSFWVIWELIHRKNPRNNAQPNSNENLLDSDYGF